jgi:tight adherence protein B
MTGWPAILLAASAAALSVAPLPDGALRLAVVAPPPRREVPLLTGLCAGAVVAAWFAGGPVAGLLVGAGGLLLHRSGVQRRAVVDRQQERARAVEALAVLGAELRAGRSPADAFDAASGVACGTSAAAFVAASAAARLGGDVGAALRGTDSAVSAALHALAACWQVCSEAGNGLAAAVDRLEEGLRAAETQRRAVAAELAGPRATVQLLAVLPVVGIALAAALGARPLDLLLHTPLGLGCLSVGVLLDGLGVFWTRRLTERVMP